MLFTVLGMPETPMTVRLSLLLAAAAIQTLAFVRYELIAGFAMVVPLSWRLPFPIDPQSRHCGTTIVLRMAALSLPVWG